MADLSALLCVMFACVLSLSIWGPGSDVILDCINICDLCLLICFDNQNASHHLTGLGLKYLYSATLKGTGYYVIPIIQKFALSVHLSVCPYSRMNPCWVL